jgi:hypothetical protein
MTAAELLSRLSRKAIANEDTELCRIFGVATGLINPNKELSSAQVKAIISGLQRGGAGDDETDMEAALDIAELIRSV